MGNYENIVKIEEIKRKVNEGDLLSAQRILDTMDIKKIKNMADLNLIAEVYTENERLEEAADIYLKIFDKAKSRKALFHLIEVIIGLNNIEDAEYYLRQYQKMAPKDFYNYVFRYRIDKMKGESFEHLIEILEELKNIEYTEKWAYELAKLYYKAGMEEACIRECSDIELWFGDGIYVEKAKILRSTYSGEADKERIMEEIKRRAGVITGRNEDEDQPEEQFEKSSVNGSDLGNADRTESVDTSEAVGDDDLYPGMVFSVSEETDEYENNLKKDIQDMMVQEQTGDISYYDEDEADEEFAHDDIQFNTERRDNEPVHNVKEEEEQGDKELFHAMAEEEPANDERILSDKSIQEQERETAENEVEHAIYQLLEEESIDEEDRRLKQLMEELQMDAEELFGNFLHVVSVKKQLVKSLDLIMSDHEYNLMLIITGTEGSGKTTLAKEMALFFCKSGKLKSSKMAKITAEKLNTVDVLAKKEILKDCCLVIENASDLKRNTIDNLMSLSELVQGEIAIVFEDDKKNMNKLFREYPKLMDILKNRIHLPQYNAEDLMGFAFACLKQKDYSLDRKSEQVLQTKINQIVKQSEPHRHLEQIYDLMQAAMNAADIRLKKQLATTVPGRNVEDEETVVVIPDDFTVKP